jgi:hypothetical protein
MGHSLLRHRPCHKLSLDSRIHSHQNLDISYYGYLDGKLQMASPGVQNYLAKVRVTRVLWLRNSFLNFVSLTRPFTSNTE